MQEAGTIMLPLSRGAVSYISEIDADLAKVKWSLHSEGYAERMVKNGAHQRKVYLHRVVLARKLDRPLLPGEQVDHQDSDRLNNTRENLRPATGRQNQANQGRKAHNTSGYKGVSFDRSRDLWTAQVHIDGKAHSLGRFATAKEAYIAYVEACQHEYGEFFRADCIEDDLMGMVAPISHSILNKFAAEVVWAQSYKGAN